MSKQTIRKPKIQKTKKYKEDTNNKLIKYLDNINYPYNHDVTNNFIDAVFSSKELSKHIKIKKWENAVRFYLLIIFYGIFVYFNLIENDIALLIIGIILLIATLMVPLYNTKNFKKEGANIKSDVNFITKILNEKNYKTLSRIEGLKFCLSKKLKAKQNKSSIITTAILSVIIIIVQNYCYDLTINKIVLIVLAIAIIMLMFREIMPSDECFKIIKTLELINTKQLFD